MIANELNRAKNMLAKNDTCEMKQALERAFELLDLTVENARENLQYELLRFRELLGELYLHRNPNSESIQRLTNALLSTNREACALVHDE